MNKIDIVLYLNSIQPANANILLKPLSFISDYLIISFSVVKAQRIMK